MTSLNIKAYRETHALLDDAIEASDPANKAELAAQVYARVIGERPAGTPIDAGVLEIKVRELEARNEKLLKLNQQFTDEKNQMADELRTARERLTALQQQIDPLRAEIETLQTVRRDRAEIVRAAESALGQSKHFRGTLKDLLVVAKCLGYRSSNSKDAGGEEEEDI